MATLLGRLTAALLVVNLTWPRAAHADEDDDAAAAEEAAMERRSRRPGTEAERKKPTEEDAGKEEEEEGEDSDAPRAIALPFKLPELEVGRKRHRYAFIGGGVLLLGGLAFAYSAQGEARRAETIASARQAQQTLNGARQSAATANLFYGLAAVTFAYALVLELVPEPALEKTGLTFHF